MVLWFIYPTGRKRVCKIRFVSTGENRGKPCLVCKKIFHIPIHTKSNDLFVLTTTAKSIPHRCVCGISVAIFGISYTRRSTSLNIRICWMTSEFHICNVEKWNCSSKLQTHITSLYLWLKTSSVGMDFLSKILVQKLFLFWNVCFPSLRLFFCCCCFFSWFRF